MAERIQLSRAKGWRMPPNTVKVDRSTIYGNPFRVGEDPSKTSQWWSLSEEFRRRFHGDRSRWPWAIRDAAEAVEAFRELATGRERETLIHIAQHDLRGKNLACWCKLGAPCHADVLLELANAPDAASIQNSSRTEPR